MSRKLITPWPFHKLYTKKCNPADCNDPRFHTHHLSWLGIWRFTGIPPWRMLITKRALSRGR